jgi:hypothetical protein
MLQQVSNEKRMWRGVTQPEHAAAAAIEVTQTAHAAAAAIDRSQTEEGWVMSRAESCMLHAALSAMADESQSSIASCWITCAAQESKQAETYCMQGMQGMQR